MIAIKIFGKIKTCSPLLLSKHQKGGNSMDEDKEFRELFRRLVDCYEIDPDTADEILRQILQILFPEETETNFERDEDEQ